MFLFYLLNQDTNTVVYKCFVEQSKHELPGDWILQARNDLEMLKINYTFEEIKSTSKLAFQKYVKNKIKMYAFQYLQEERRKQTKCRYVDYNKFEMQDYLKSDLLTTYQKKLCFQLRTSSYPVYKNIPYLKEDTLCPCCLLFEDTMSHQLVCSTIHSNTNKICNRIVSIEDVFSRNIENQAKLTSVFEQAIKRRKIILNNIS